MWKNRYVFIFSLILFVSCKYNDKNILVNNELLNENKIEESFDFINYYELNDELINPYIENNICEIHNKIMDMGNVKIYYGLIRPNKTLMEYYELRSKYFPNSNDALNGGCIVTDINYYEKYICNECNNERDKYKNILGLN
jgi:hypothetical protein